MTKWFDGGRSRTRRLALGLTQRDLAEMARVSTPHLSGIEAGHRQPSPHAALRLARALGVSLADLISEEEQ